MPKAEYSDHSDLFREDPRILPAPTVAKHMGGIAVFLRGLKYTRSYTTLGRFLEDPSSLLVRPHQSINPTYKGFRTRLSHTWCHDIHRNSRCLSRRSGCHKAVTRKHSDLFREDLRVLPAHTIAKHMGGIAVFLRILKYTR